VHWTQIYDPFGRWWLSTLVATLPILVLFGLLVGLKVKPHWCAIAGATTAADKARGGRSFRVQVGRFVNESDAQRLKEELASLLKDRQIVVGQL
jgi:hypothetical protein